MASMMLGVVLGGADVQKAAVGVDGRDTGLVFLAPREVEPNEVHAATVPKLRLPAAVSCVFVTIPNVLASRYASDEMVAIWSPEAKIVARAPTVAGGAAGAGRVGRQTVPGRRRSTTTSG